MKESQSGEMGVSIQIPTPRRETEHRHRVDPAPEDVANLHISSDTEDAVIQELFGAVRARTIASAIKIKPTITAKLPL